MKPAIARRASALTVLIDMRVQIPVLVYMLRLDNRTSVSLSLGGGSRHTRLVVL